MFSLLLGTEQWPSSMVFLAMVNRWPSVLFIYLFFLNFVLQVLVSVRGMVVFNLMRAGDLVCRWEDPWLSMLHLWGPTVTLVWLTLHLSDDRLNSAAYVLYGVFISDRSPLVGVPKIFFYSGLVFDGHYCIAHCCWQWRCWVCGWTATGFPACGE